MGDFCKGAAIGMLAGVAVGAIIVAKNKKLSNKLKQGVDAAEDKFMEVKNSLEDKINELACDCGGGNSSSNSSGNSSQDGQNNAENMKNNFSKKNKND